MPVTVLALLCAICAQPGQAASPCPISLQQGGDIGAVDGRRGAEWDDAAILASSSPLNAGCLGTLLDEDGSFRPVVIRSKSYVDGSGAAWLAMFLEIEDVSETQSDGTTLANGEVLVLQLDPSHDEGGELSQGPTALSRDWKIELRHFWQTASGASDPDEVATAMRLFDSSGDSPFCVIAPATSLPHWNEITSGLTPATTPKAAVRKDLPQGYTVEIAVPMALIGNPSGDVGVALAVVNDHGSCAGGSGVCDGHGLAFPTDLPVTNADNPVLGCGYGWIAPQTWATGYFDRAPGDVTMSHTPRFWTSEDVNALACGVPDNNYYPAGPCRMSVRANIRNSSASSQIRNLLILRGQHGAGVVNWTYVDLIEGVTVTAGGQIASESDETSDLTGLSGHPCVRAYVLPPTLDPGFDLTRMQSISSAADLDDLVATYGLRAEHSAQQNISRRPAAETCPDAACEIEAWWHGFGRPMPHGGLSLIPTAHAQEAPRPDTPRAAVFTLPPGDRAPTGDPVARVLDGLGTDVGLAAEQLAEIAKQDAVVEIIALGYRDPDNVEPPLPDPRFNFLEIAGGAVERIPLARINEGEAITLTLGVGNPADAVRHLGLSIRTHDPTGSGLTLALDDPALTATPFDPYETRLLVLVAGREDVIRGGGTGAVGVPWPWLGLALLILLLALYLWRRGRA
jgi:hypothetical protein